MDTEKLGNHSKPLWGEVSNWSYVGHLGDDMLGSLAGKGFITLDVWMARIALDT